MADGKSSGLGMIALFAAWYGCNAGYNVYNSFVKVDYPFAYAIAMAQLGVGFIYAVPLWVLGFRQFPKISFGDFLTLLPIGTQ